MPHPVLDAADLFRRQALAREREAATRLVQTYGRVYRNLQAQQTALEQALTAIQGAHQEVSRGQAARLGAVRSLLQQTADELERWAQYADTEVSQAAQNEILAGLSDSRGMVQAYFSNPRTQAAIAARFDMLPAEQVETMLGFVGQGSPLRASWAGFGEAVVTQLEQALVDGIALGYNPRRIAREIFRQRLGVGLNWALTTARTSQLWAYREATRQNYRNNSDLVSGWVWYAQIGDDRTCMSCVAKHGSHHSLEEPLNDHHAGRCVALPEVPLAKKLGLSMPEVQPGPEWFRGLPPAEQERRMGGSMFDAWQAGEFEFEDLSVEYEDHVYGTMVREASLVGLLGERAQEYYRR